jgi:hypothetical protein
MSVGASPRAAGRRSAPKTRSAKDGQVDEAHEVPTVLKKDRDEWLQAAVRGCRRATFAGDRGAGSGRVPRGLTPRQVPGPVDQRPERSCRPCGTDQPGIRRLLKVADVEELVG